MINTQEYITKLQKHQRTILESASKVINATIKNMFEKIVDRTPVGNPSLWQYPAPKGYNPGTLRASWGIAYNTNNAVRSSSGKFTSLQTGGIRLSLNSSHTQNATIYNNQPYAQRVEFGWSKQAPAGMMRITVREYESFININTRIFGVK